MGDFKVVIVGGSVAGLTLAIVLERYGIDFVLLEKYSNIAPQLGASIGILPHGARILDQLGIYTQIEAISSSVGTLETYGPDGRSLNKPEPIGEVFDSLIGYRMQFLERRQLLQILFDNVEDKTKVQTSSDVCRINHLESGVEVMLKDGRTVSGDLVVGADGVHSPLRSEIWRIAESETKNYNPEGLRKSIQANYKCLFGIARSPEGMPEETLFKSYHKNHSYLCATAPDNKLFFLLFAKTPEVAVYQDIPRYTQEDAKRLAAEYAGDRLFRGMTFGDMCKDLTMDCNLVPVQEFVLEKCFYKRAVLIGDSFHKVNPLSGHGGNSAIESAALLGDLLKSTLDNSPRPKDKDIQRILSEFQRIRRPRADLLMTSTRQLQRMEGLETLLRRFMTLNVTSKLGAKSFGPIIARASSSGRSLKFLPQNYRRGAVSLDEEVAVDPNDRSKASSLFWIFMMVSVAIVTLGLRQFLGEGQKGEFKRYDLLQNYDFFINMAINALWVVESYRPGLLLSPLLSGIPYIILSSVIGWEITLPVYFMLYIVTCGARPFYYPMPRAINPAVAKILPIGLLFTYLPIALKLATNPFPETTGHLHPAVGTAMLLAHIGLPIILHPGRILYAKLTKDSSLIEYLYGTSDMKRLSEFFSFVTIIASTAHGVYATRIMRATPELTFSAISNVLGSSKLSIASLSVTIVLWCTFTAWDLRRVNLTKISPVLVFLASATGAVVFGPGAVLSSLWMWREQALQRGRAIQEESPKTEQSK